MQGNAGRSGRRRGARKRTLGATALAVGLAALLGAPPALAAPQVDGEFSLPGSALGSNNYLTTGPDGNIWVTLETGNDVARITPAGNVQQFNPGTLNNPGGITAGPNNTLWVTQANQIARFSPGNPDGAQAFAANGVSSQSGITVGPDGNLWVGAADNVLKITPGNPNDQTAIPVAGLGPRGITAAGGNRVWVADFGSDRVVSVTTAGNVTSFAVGGGPQDVAGGPGTQVAYTQPTMAPQHVGRISPGGAPQKTNTPGTDPFGVVFANDGAYWIGQFASSNLGRLTPEGQYSTLSGFSANAGPRRITTGPNNTLWVALDNAEKVARVTGVEPGGGPSNEFAFGKVKRNKKKGTAKLTVEVPGPGKVELAKTKKVKADKETAEAEGDVKLLVKAKGKARKRLNKKGKAKVKAKVTYTPDGGEPNTQTKKLKLKRRRR